MRTRAYLLAVAYAGVTLAFLRWGPLLPAEWYRRALFWALPLATGLLAVLLLPSPPARSTAPGWPALRLIVAAALGLAVAQSAILLAMRMGWLIFTYGDQSLSSAPVLVLAWSVPAAFFLGVCAERGLRGSLYATLESTSGPGWAWVVTLGCGVALSLPALVPGFGVTDRGFVLAGLAVALCREAALTLLYRGGGLLLAGAARGVLVVLDAIGLNDVLSPHFPAANYVVGDPRFYLLRAAAAAAGLAVVAVGCRRALSMRASMPTSGPA